MIEKFHKRESLAGIPKNFTFKLDLQVSHCLEMIAKHATEKSA